MPKGVPTDPVIRDNIGEYLIGKTKLLRLLKWDARTWGGLERRGIVPKPEGRGFYSGVCILDLIRLWAPLVRKTGAEAQVPSSKEELARHKAEQEYLGLALKNLREAGSLMPVEEVREGMTRLGTEMSRIVETTIPEMKALDPSMSAEVLEALEGKLQALRSLVVNQKWSDGDA